MIFIEYKIYRKPPLHTTYTRKAVFDLRLFIFCAAFRWFTTFSSAKPCNYQFTRNLQELKSTRERKAIHDKPDTATWKHIILYTSHHIRLSTDLTPLDVLIEGLRSVMRRASLILRSTAPSPRASIRTIRGTCWPRCFSRTCFASGFLKWVWTSGSLTESTCSCTRSWRNLPVSSM